MSKKVNKKNTTTVSFGVQSALNNFVGQADLSLDQLNAGLVEVRKAVVNSEEAEKSVTDSYTSVAVMTEDIARATNSVPVTLMRKKTSQTDANWLDDHPDYTQDQLNLSRPLFNYLHDECKRQEISFQAIQSNSYYTNGKKMTDSALERGEKAGVFAEGTTEKVKAERAQKRTDTEKEAKARRKERLAQSDLLRTKPDEWAQGRVNAIITEIHEAEIKNKSVMKIAGLVESILTECSKSLNEL